VNAWLARGLALSVAWPSLALAADPPAASATSSVTCPKGGAESKAVGDQAMLDQNYALALACYEDAYVNSPTPPLLYNRARALQMLGRKAEALKLLRTFRRVASPELQAKVSGLDTLMESLEGQVAAVQVDCNVEGAEVRVDGVVVGQAPLPEPIVVDTGSVLVEVSASGYKGVSRTVAASEGARLVVVADLIPETGAAGPVGAGAVASPTAPAATAPAATAPEPASVQPAPVPPPDVSSPATNWPAWIALGVGGASAGVAVFSFAKASSAADQVCDGRRSCTQSEHDASAFDSYETYKDVYAGSLIVAGVGLAVGGFLLWTSDAGRTEATLTPTGVRVQGRF
jgi:hypothetical protein